MNKLNQWLTLVANLSVVAGIVFLAVQMQQNTEAIQAQTRDSITEKQMQVSEWIGTNGEAASVYGRGSALGMEAFDDETERMMFRFLVQGYLRVWENSYYQFERGLFTQADFEARLNVWRFLLGRPGYRDIWAESRERFAPDFRAEIDRIVAEVGQAQ